VLVIPVAADEIEFRAGDRFAIGVEDTATGQGRFRSLRQLRASSLLRTGHFRRRSRRWATQRGGSSQQAGAEQ